MTISFNTIPSNTLVPLFYAEMDNLAANTAQDSGASLLIGHANNGAEIVANSLVLMPSADYARQICGAGSQLARMVEAYRQTDPFGELYVIAVPEATGAAATVTLTVIGAATETGTVCPPGPDEQKVSLRMSFIFSSISNSSASGSTATDAAEV